MDADTYPSVPSFAAACFPAGVLDDPPSWLACAGHSLGAAVLIVERHRGNIARIRAAMSACFPFGGEKNEELAIIGWRRLGNSARLCSRAPVRSRPSLGIRTGSRRPHRGHPRQRPLPAGVMLPPNVRAGDSLEGALAGADVVLSVMPSHVVRPLYTRIAPLLESPSCLVSATKGLEEGTLLRSSQIIAEVTRNRFPIAVLSGPPLPAM